MFLSPELLGFRIPIKENNNQIADRNILTEVTASIPAPNIKAEIA